MSVKTVAEAGPETGSAPRRPAFSIRGVPHSGLLAVLVVVVVATALRTDTFTTDTNLVNILRQVSINAVIAAGLTLLMTAGGMDFSMGSVVVVTAAVGAQMLSHGWPTWTAVLAVLVLGTLIGLVNGVVATFTTVAPFVITLATATLLDGVCLLVLNGQTVSIGTRMFALGNEKIAGVPYLLIVAVLVMAATALVMRFTVFGRDAYAIGGNEHVARLSGIDVAARKLSLYATTGALAGLAGLMTLSRLGSSSPGAGGLSIQLTAVAAVVIGGTSLAGGHGTILGTALGVILLGVVANALNLVQISTNWQPVSVGAVLLVAAIANEVQKSRSTRD
ncbi:ABC transporter permease [Streptomyces sp. NPDC090106]|uniref:ABC transporter permease n=1 Tax=Streptomyces sp. NPDC090106 TaxID=3365946 RepID=UPI003811582F